MKCILAILLATFALCRAAFHPSECGRLQRLLVKQQWAEAFSYGLHREELDEDLFRELLDKHPEWRKEYFLRVLGENIYSPEFRAHMARVMSGFDTSISLLTNPEVLAADLNHLGHQHSEMHIPEEAFDSFQEALLHAVQRRIGHCFNWDAWNLCIGEIMNGIKSVIHADEQAAGAGNDEPASVNNEEAAANEPTAAANEEDAAAAENAVA